jgi:hypothetical protein
VTSLQILRTIITLEYFATALLGLGIAALARLGPCYWPALRFVGLSAGIPAVYGGPLVLAQLAGWATGYELPRLVGWCVAFGLATFFQAAAAWRVVADNRRETKAREGAGT